jgi:hypothetical protein
MKVGAQQAGHRPAPSPDLPGPGWAGTWPKICDPRSYPPESKANKKNTTAIEVMKSMKNIRLAQARPLDLRHDPTETHTRRTISVSPQSTEECIETPDLHNTPAPAWVRPGSGDRFFVGLSGLAAPRGAAAGGAVLPFKNQGESTPGPRPDRGWSKGGVLISGPEGPGT